MKKITVKLFSKYTLAVAALLMAFSAGWLTGCAKQEKITQAGSPVASGPVSKPVTVPATGSIEVAFSPNFGATGTIVKALQEAKKSILVQAYSFTSKEIAQALADAKKRGVDVKVILDKSQETEKYTSATFLANQQIPVKIDRAFAIAHSKIMIIDETNVITGSFNFTQAAENNNAENVLVIRGNKELANLYIQNWQWRWSSCDFYEKK